MGGGPRPLGLLALLLLLSLWLPQPAWLLPTRRFSRTARRAAPPGILEQWHADRRARVLGSLDWTRYHLWVYFVDAVEPSYARAKLARFFFEKVCEVRDSSSLLYCAAGGLARTREERADLALISSVPSLHAGDLQNLMVPPYTFVPGDLDTYDVVVAADEATGEAVRSALQEAGKKEPEHLCVLGDFADAYDVLLAAEAEQSREPAEDVMRPGVLSLEGLKNLKPGQPLRGTPGHQAVGAPLEFLPESWSELWAAAAGEADIELTGEGVTVDLHRLKVGQILRSAVGLERCLRNSIPSGMRWWNDEE